MEHRSNTKCLTGCYRGPYVVYQSSGLCADALDGRIGRGKRNL